MARINQNDRELLEAMQSLMYTLTGKQQEILRLRYGLDGRRRHTQKELAEKWGIPVYKVRRIEDYALYKLRYSSRTRLNESSENQEANQQENQQSSVELKEIIETVKRLTPELIVYLSTHEHDLEKIHWQVFEHLIAEFFASWGFEDVALVGRNSKTAADIFAAYKINAIGERIRYFIEVKRWKDKVGVEVIDRVYGAMLFERPQYGWHAAMIVSVVGFKDFEKYTREELAKKGILLREREDLLRWLKDYKPNKNGLWLPNPSKSLSI